ncbi:MAG: 30S ribosomal protein S1 [Candidatus Pristimantibacillus lignocellulolyticus]|uniref:30S ribosomal protein S1 n=1 Tax=Candidatus Pristimantibacillus lignocellulolyticus TaxID=2994561 RepID=A0A9J6ZD91_9BACL|nr:MAG: 30S ribosomal protein S1 [Candidatus Pristimantibacillus lignocellulolyticus]
MSEEVKEQDSVVEESNQAALDHMVALKKGDFVKGTIVKIEDNVAYVSVGYKYDGIITLRELSSVQAQQATDVVKVGEEVELKVLSIDDNKETMTLSKRLVDNEKGWDDIDKLLEKKEVFEVVVADVVKGGLVVDVGVRAFIPSSMVERHFVEDFSDYKGRTLRVIVKEIDRENNKVILSQKDVLEAEYQEQKAAKLATIQVGQELTAIVQRVTTFGAFVDLGGVDGLVHVSELAWEHVTNAADVVTVGQQVQVKVLKVEAEKGKISLSIKAAQPGPWENITSQFNVGDIVTGKVKRVTTFGAFVEISAGIEGLVHISQLAYRRVNSPYEVVKEGQEVQVKILEFNPADKRISLSIKQTQEAPATEAEDIEVNMDEVDKTNVSLNGNNMSFSLAELFGDKLSQFK